MHVFEQKKLTSEKRHEMLHYKQLAVDVEKKIEKSREIKGNGDCDCDCDCDRDCDCNGNGDDELFSIETAEPSPKDSSQLTFSEDCNKAVLNLLDDSVQAVQENEMALKSALNHTNDLISFEESSDERESHLNFGEDILRLRSSERSEENKENQQQIRKKDKVRSFSMNFGKMSGRRWASERKRRPKTTDLVSFRNSELTNTLEEILNRFHESQMHKFSELIEKQQVEHKNLLKQLETNQKSLIESLQNSLKSFNLGCLNVESLSKEGEKKASVATTEKASANVDAALEAKNAFQHSNPDFDSSLFSRTLYVTTNSSMDIGQSIHADAENDFLTTATTPSTARVSPITKIQKGIHAKDSISNQVDRKNEACTKIQAFVRGFLVRRLMRTVKVQEMIKTIKDSIKCLDQLYIEDRNCLMKSDIFLSERIMKQIEAAVCEFNKIFFDLSTSEKLEIIRSDREILKQREFKRMSQRLVGNRPFSASTVSSSKSFRSSRL